MKRKLLALIPAAFLLFSCDLFTSTINNNNGPKVIDDITDDDIDDDTHASKVSADPNAPFYLKIDESKTLKVSFDKTPTNEEEKLFDWSVSVPSIVSMKVANDTRSATVTGIKTGDVEITATNKADSSLFVTFVAHVIDFDSDNAYLWQYQTSDRAQFGYSSDNKQGNATGTAMLGSLGWDFTRSETTSLQSANGAIGFGKGKEPEKLVTLTNKNKRVVQQVILETSSANSLATCTVKVGEETIINKKAPAVSDNGVGRIESLNNLNLSGDITIKYETPAFEQDKYDADPFGYKAPGAIYLKSIYIIYAPEAEPEYVTESTLDFVNMFQNKEENQDFWSGIVASTAKEKNYTKDGINYYFEKIKAPTDAEYFNTNGKIIINVPEGEVISKVQLKTTKVTSSKNVYNGFGSIVNGDPFSIQLGVGTDDELSFKVNNEHINSVMLKNSGTSNVGLVSLTVKTVAGTHAQLKEVKFLEGAKPTKVEYSVGEKFAPEGLGEAVGSFVDTSIDSIQIPLDCFKFYDGTSYDADPATAVEELDVNSTYVYAVYKSFAIKIEGLTVIDIPVALTLVKNVSDITSSGRYYLVSTEKKALVKGSAAGDMKARAGIASLGDNFVFGDSITLPGLYKNDGLHIDPADGGFTIKCDAGNMIGMTDSGSISTAANPGNKVFSISINAESGVATFEISHEGETTITRYLVFGTSTLSLVEANSANISIYKVAE